VASLLLCSGVFGCSSTDQLKKQVSALESEITAMRADHDRLEERLSAVELNASVPRTPVTPAATADRVERPRLKVIHLAPEDSESTVEPADAPASSAPDSPARRPIIRGTGDRVIKIGDGDAPDESTRREVPPRGPLADLGAGSHAP
jgi:hypothetical protein